MADPLPISPDALRESVEALERATAAEIVVVLARRSDPYPEAAGLAAALCAGLVLAVALYSPILFWPWVVWPSVVATGALAALLLRRGQPRLTRWLTSRQRRVEAVERAARAAFVEESVHGTSGRHGLLVYVSALEQRVAVVPDLGLRQALAPGALGLVRWGEGDDPHAIDTTENLLAGMRALGELLAEALPRQEDDKNELPDAPRVRP